MSKPNRTRFPSTMRFAIGHRPSVSFDGSKVTVRCRAAPLVRGHRGAERSHDYLDLELVICSWASLGQFAHDARAAFGEYRAAQMRSLNEIFGRFGGTP